MQSFSEQLRQHQQRLAQALETLGTLESIEPAPLPAETLLQIDSMTLRYYPSQKPSQKPSQSANENIKSARPLLICYALINRPYILDLEPGRSLVRDLLDAGHSVYLIDWGYPKATDRYLGLDDYINDYLHTAVRATLKHAESAQLDLLGVCQGGVFSLCYAALYPHHVEKLITLVTPVDTEVDNFTLAQMVREVNIEALVATRGNIAGELLNQLYASLKPLELGIAKQLSLAKNLTNKRAARTFLRMEHWLNDSPDITGRSAIEFAEGFFKRNGLVNGTLKIGDREVDIGQIKQPVLNAYGSKDHLVPPASAAALRDVLTSTEAYTELELNGGHIGAFISSRTRSQLVKAINEFRHESS
ncbi:MAG: alpha/beta fold hydrolase [Oceanospirillaceae bacterium]|nr:alpha/beta fold hydrolase [Oceanospirillaceae bacterium]